MPQRHRAGGFDDGPRSGNGNHRREYRVSQDELDHLISPLAHRYWRWARDLP
jgi:hypothetical protein